MASGSQGTPGMSLPRRVRPGTTYLLTRRTTRRYFLFRPDLCGTQEQLFWYCLAVAAEKHGVLVHSVILVSNHLHIVLTDVRGVLPLFLRDFHRWLALATKAHRGWPAEVLDKRQTSAVEPVTDAALVERMGYVIANGPLSGLVRYAHDWPGPLTRVDDIGERVVRARRPAHWFDAGNPDWPDEAELAIVMPDALVDRYGSLEAARREIAAEVRRREREALAEAKRQGRGFLGAERALRTKITDRGRKWELFGARNPTFAAGGDREAAQKAVEELQTFRHEYRQALGRWRQGDREVIFPFGTWWMCVHHGARRAPPPD
jgi:putative transposase